MAKRKLTAKTKDHLYANRWRVRQSDYAGDALEYLLRLRRASKAAKTRANNIAKIGDVTIPRNSELYETIERSAELKGQSVKKFIQQNKEAIEHLMEDGRVVVSRETSYAITDINKLPKRSKIYINGVETGKGDAIYALQSLTSSATQFTDTVIINFEMSYDLSGNLYLTLPTEDEIEEAELAEDGGDSMYELLEASDGLVPIVSSGNGKKGNKGGKSNERR